MGLLVRVDFGVSCWGGGGKNCFGVFGDFGREGVGVRTEWVMCGVGLKDALKLRISSAPG